MKKYIILTIAAGCFLLNGCGDYLDQVPKGIKAPQTIADYRAFLARIPQSYESGDKGYISNEFNPNPYYMTGYNVTNYNWITDGTTPRVGVVAKDDAYNHYYTAIYHYNLVINEVPKAKTYSAAEEKEVKQLVAQARVGRAFYYFHAVNSYAKAYNPETADTEQGIPYITTHDTFEGQIPQVSVGEVYKRIMEDLDLAIPDLPSISERLDYQRATQASGYALRARVNLFMHNFDAAMQDAADALKLNDFIFDLTVYYKTNVIDVYGRNIQYDANSNAIYGLPNFNDSEPARNEYLLYAFGQAIYGKRLNMEDPPENENCVRDSTMFEEGDARFLTNFWRDAANNVWNFRRYDLQTTGSIKTTEMHLILAECYARKGDAANLQKAMAELNIIRKKRILPDYYTDLTPSTKAEAIRLIRLQRQVELMFSDMLFYDLRRFNTEPEYALTLKKKDADGIIRTIEPDSPLWVLPFGNDVMSKNPGLKQNTTL